MQVNDDKLSRTELDELRDEEGESIPEGEDPKSDDQFSGTELDELGDEKGESNQVSGNELREEEGESIPEGEDPKSIRGKLREKKRLLLCIGIGLCLLIGTGYLYLKNKKYEIVFYQKEVNQKKEEAPQFNRLPIPKDQLLIFHSFVVPFKESKRFTYISLSIYFNVPNKELRREMIEKKDLLRGIIYDILREEINKIKEIPSLEKLKEFTIRGVNMGLSAGKVNEVYITKFLAV